MAKKTPKSLYDITGNPVHKSIVSGGISAGMPVTAGGYYVGKVRPRWMPRFAWRVAKRWWRAELCTLIVEADAEASDHVVGVAISPTDMVVRIGRDGPAISVRDGDKWYEVGGESDETP